MWRDKFFRHSLSFWTIVVASALLKPAAGFHSNEVVWLLLALVIAANLVALATR